MIVPARPVRPAPTVLWRGLVFGPLLALPFSMAVLIVAVLGDGPMRTGGIDGLLLVAALVLATSYVGVLLVAMPLSWLLRRMGVLEASMLCVAGSLVAAFVATLLDPQGWHLPSNGRIQLWTMLFSAITAVAFCRVAGIRWFAFAPAPESSR